MKRYRILDTESLIIRDVVCETPKTIEEIFLLFDLHLWDDYLVFDLSSGKIFYSDDFSTVAELETYETAKLP